MAGGQRLAARPRILITGCPIGGAAEKVVRAIEENGGWVVGFENCTGAKATSAAWRRRATFTMR
ncbi:2-hydroxyglutaryl-CoA dehydratase, D-component [Raoultella terrigena]|uniref:2-hydroxyglutaryl-CoA dehydratase, D-component n=1 Tax=Raoultella terrigena TaxID=577 RepID=A0A4U9D5A1_RAOTE|nr:2-hydroxyglutaryl-CoA dehydratase, D-component [Raoultella terrigena]